MNGDPAVHGNPVQRNQLHDDPAVHDDPALGDAALGDHFDRHGQLDLTGHTALDEPGQELDLSHRQVRDFTTPRAGRISPRAVHRIAA